MEISHTLKLTQEFKERKIKAKDIFSISVISKNEGFDFIRQYHYLKDAKYFAKFSYGLFLENKLVGVATFSNPQGIVSLKSWFGFDNTNQTVMELHRLCMMPDLNGSNATSYLLANSIKKLKGEGIQAIITLADDSRHIGSIYQVCNFKYYGLTDKKTDFYTIDGKLNPRGQTKDIEGVWLPRTRKHRYAYIIDRKLNILLDEQKRPQKQEGNLYDCCGGSLEVFDKRFNKKYSCPKCTDKIEEL